jgi:hypothetical protein
MILHPKTGEPIGDDMCLRDSMDVVRHYDDCEPGQWPPIRGVTRPAKRTVTIELSEQAYSMLEFRAKDCGYASVEEGVRRDVAACVHTTFEGREDSEIAEIFEVKRYMQKG